MFPIQYPTNSIAEKVILFVKPPTLDVMRLKAIGISAANIAASQIPASRVYLCSLLTVKTMIMPMRDSETRDIIHMT